MFHISTGEADPERTHPYDLVREEQVRVLRQFNQFDAPGHVLRTANRP